MKYDEIAKDSIHAKEKWKLRRGCDWLVGLSNKCTNLNKLIDKMFTYPWFKMFLVSQKPGTPTKRPNFARSPKRNQEYYTVNPLQSASYFARSMVSLRGVSIGFLQNGPHTMPLGNR
jgi:hypothetical protein